MTNDERNTLNRRIAIAAGWKHTPGEKYGWWSPDGLRQYQGCPCYHLDPGAALEAARVIVDRPWRLAWAGPWQAEYLRHRGTWVDGEWTKFTADTPALALTAMIEAVLDAKEGK